MSIRRINLYSGPGGGKSTVAAFLFAELKVKGFSVEIVPEYVKIWTYINRKPKSWDQLYMFSKQLHKEDLFLDGGIDLIISDSPLYLNNWYAENYNLPGKEEMCKLADKFEEKFPSIHIFLDRQDIEFSQTGRYHNKDESIKIDKSLKKMLEKRTNNFSVVSTTDREKTLEIILGELQK